LIDRPLQAGAKALGRVVLTDDLAAAAEEDPRLRLIRDQRAVIPRPRRPPDAGLLTIVEGEAEKIAEGGEGSLGRIASVSASLRALSCASPRVDPLPSPRSRSASTR